MKNNKLIVVNGNEEVEVFLDTKIVNTLREVIRSEIAKKDRRIYKDGYVESEIFELSINQKSHTSK